MNCIWRVYPSGNLKKIICFQKELFWYRGSVYYGDNSPLLSPDQNHVAVIRQGDLWIFEPDTQKLIRLTKVARPRTDRYLSIELNTISWSWDSTRLLYSVSSGDPGSGDDGPDRKVRPAKYGFYIYDVRAKSTKFISESYSECDFDKMVPNFNRVVLQWPQDGTTMINGHKINKKLSSGHIDISPDGRWLLARADEPREARGKDPRSQIVKINLNNYEVIPLTPVGGWAEYQWPKSSPSGKHILYQWQNGLEEKEGKSCPKENIVVDGKNIYASNNPQGLSDCSWIDDDTIAFTSVSTNNELEIIIIDRATGEIKGQHRIGKAP